VVREVARFRSARQRDGRSVARVVVDAIWTIAGTVEPTSAVDWVGIGRSDKGLTRQQTGNDEPQVHGKDGDNDCRHHD